MSCQALANRYIGKGKDRELFSGTCVLEHGHDGDHLPAQLAYKQQYDAAYNAALDDVIAIEALDLDSPVAESIKALRRT